MGIKTTKKVLAVVRAWGSGSRNKSEEGLAGQGFSSGMSRVKDVLFLWSLPFSQGQGYSRKDQTEGGKGWRCPSLPEKLKAALAHQVTLNKRDPG